MCNQNHQGPRQTERRDGRPRIREFGEVRSQPVVPLDWPDAGVSEDREGGVRCDHLAG